MIPFAQLSAFSVELCIALVLNRAVRSNQKAGRSIAGLSLLLALAGAGYWKFHMLASNNWRSLENQGVFAQIQILHPLDAAVMPANMPAPVIFWNTNGFIDVTWVAGFKTAGEKWLFSDIQPMWRPPKWGRIKAAARGAPIELVVGAFASKENKLIARSSLRFHISSNAVEHPLFFREVNLPFADAVKDPSRIRWRFGSIAGPEPPPIVLEKLPVCGNCHSFPRNGELLAMDVDYANSKGSYIVTKTRPEMQLATSEIITWDDFRREDGQQTFGLLSQISPDGRYVLSTVKDSSVFVPKPELAFSQLFFPLRGIIVVYDREKKTFASLPGADDPAYVQSNPTWSPDSKWIIFARHTAVKAINSRDKSSILLSPEDCADFLNGGREFRYDLYRVPFNDGKGGQPEPLPGASRNGKSNYFPKFSPDGHWIIFCQSTNYMLLRPDSQLFIIPAEGGEARLLSCNLSRMNSWHTWSPDGRWLVFSSKAHSDYTQLYLTRISEQGEASPAVWLAHMVEAGRAANIPEFVSLAPNAIVKIREQFLDDHSYYRAGNQFSRAGEVDKAIENYQTALKLNPNNSMAHQRLGFVLYHNKNQTTEAMEHMRAAVRIEPKNPLAQFDLGAALARANDLTNALPYLLEAVRLLPNGEDQYYNPVQMNHVLADVLYRLGRYAESISPLQRVLQGEPNDADANYLMAIGKARTGVTDGAIPYYQKAIRGEPLLANLPDFWDVLSQNYARQGLYAQALPLAEKAKELATKIGRTKQAETAQQLVELCRTKTGL